MQVIIQNFQAFCLHLQNDSAEWHKFNNKQQKRGSNFYRVSNYFYVLNFKIFPRRPGETGSKEQALGHGGIVWQMIKVAQDKGKNLFYAGFNKVLFRTWP